MTNHTKRVIEEEVNSLILGAFLNKKRATGEVKTLRLFKLSVQEEDKRSEKRVNFKVLEMMTKDAQDTFCWGDIVKIRCVRDDTIETGKPGGGVGGCHQSTRRSELSYYV